MTRESSGRSTWRWQVPGISESEEDIPLEDLASPRIVLKRGKKDVPLSVCAHRTSWMSSIPARPSGHRIAIDVGLYYSRPERRDDGGFTSFNEVLREDTTREYVL